MASIRVAFLWALGQNYVVLGCQFVTSMVIARLLTPAELGVFSVAAVIVGMAHILRDFGVGDYIVQEKDLTADRIRSALAVNIGLAWFLAAALAIGSWPAASFYRDEGVRSVMQVLAINFLLLPFGSIPMAVIRRNMDFAVIAEVKVVTALAGSAVSIMLAYSGMSYLSMAWGSVVSNSLIILIALRHRPRDLPFLPGVREIRRVLGFGTFASATFIMAELDKNVADLLLGRLLGMGPTGIFGRAQGLVQLMDRILMNSVWTVAMPYFAQKDRGGADVLEGFLRAVAYLTAIIWPFAVLLGFMAYPAIRILFGPQWDAAVPLVRWLCIGVIIGAPFALLGSVMPAVGQMRILSVGVFISVVCKIALILVGASYGLEYVAIAVVASSCIGALVSFTLLRKAIGLRLLPLLRAISRSFALAVASGIGPALVYVLATIDANHLWLPLAVALVTAFAGWIAAVALTSHPLKAEVAIAWGQLARRWSGRNRR